MNAGKHRHQYTHRHDGELGNCLVSGLGVDHCPEWLGIKDERCEVCGKGIHHTPPPPYFSALSRPARAAFVTGKN